MQLPRLNKISQLPRLILVFSLFYSFSAHSEEAAPPAAAAEGGGEPAKAEDPFAKEWRDESGRIQKVKSQIEKEKADLQEMFESKASVKSAGEAADLAREILKKTEEMKTDYAEYRKLQLHIRFEHPEKGDFSDRKYEREEAAEPTVEGNFDLSIQGKLDKIKSNFAAHYSVVHKKPVALSETEAERKPAAVEDSKRIVLAK